MKKILLSSCFFLLLVNLLFSEQKTFIDKEKGYNVITEANCIGSNLSEDGINEYRTTLYNWNMDTGVSTKKVQRITREVDWGMKLALAEAKAGNGQTFVVRITPVPSDEKATVYFVTALLTVNDGKYEFWDVYETVMNLDGQADAKQKSIGRQPAQEPASKNQSSKGQPVEKQQTPDVYYDQKTGYKGRASASRAGVNLSKDAVSKLKSEMTAYSRQNGSDSIEVKKLNKEENWLLQQALKKHKLVKGETYIVTIIPEPKTYPSKFSATVVVLTITAVDSRKGSVSYRFSAYKSL